MKPTILVTGGAGYIGSHVVRQLLSYGYGVQVIDDLSEGHQDALNPDILNVGDIADELLVQRIIEGFDVQAVMHFAANTLVDESVREPRKYFYNNTIKTDQLLDLLIDCGIKKFVFSSTAAVYGQPDVMPITEETPKEPTNSYGESKLLTERILRHYDIAYGLKHIALRYFNACGAHPDGDIGEDHRPETHLIPIVLQVALGQREKIHIFGTDYPTKDGTCIRDYIHVMDLAAAHVLALEALLNGAESAVYNLGNGAGHSVREVIETARQITKHPIPAVESPRRSGDPAHLVASSQRIMAELGWRPRYADLHSIIESAWRWHTGHPKGYEE